VSTTNESCSRCGGRHPPERCPAGPEVATLPSLDLLRGAIVGEYQVTGLLGEGGMGVVYSGVHPLLGRKVAIKVLNHQMAQRDEATKRFLQEARAASTLRHQNIVDVFAFGQLADGRYYQVMEFLEGESLRAMLNKRGPMPPSQARTIVIGVLAGLDVAHRRGVVHRDIKPDNIFICGSLDGGALAASDVKILDFGLAKRESAGDISVKTRSGVTMGTPAYMSPEQCRGVGSVDARTDIYAVGVMLYEMIAGRVPFQSASAFDVMFMQIKSRPTALSDLTGRAEPLEPVVVKALAKRAEDRFASARDMLAAIDAIPPGDDRAAATPRGKGGARSFTELVWRRPWRRRGVIGAAAVAAVLVVVGALALLMGARPGEEAPHAGAPPAAATRSPGLPPSAAPFPSPAAAPAGDPARTAAEPWSAIPDRPPGARPHGRSVRGAGKAKGARMPGKKTREETDVDSPMNPYAR
jgi:serine/threonine-protein kinase